VSHEYEGRVVSYGGGVNSTALVILLVGEGWRGPVVFSDTGAEWPETMEYVTLFGAWMAERGLELTVLGPEWRKGKYALPLMEYCESYRLTPFPAVRWCTANWKVAPLQGWCEANGCEHADMLLGISAEESHRQPEKDRPLVDRGIDRNGCARIIVDAGLPLPRKSGCYLCPFQSPRQWQELYKVHPALFERVAALEDAATERRADGHITTSDPSGRVTLRQLAAGYAAQGQMFDWLDYYQPCMCRVG
jgi:hypothetical protein